MIERCWVLLASSRGSDGAHEQYELLWPRSGAQMDRSLMYSLLDSSDDLV
jgi:hypothetical protein